MMRKWKMRVYPFAIQRYPHYIMTCNPFIYGRIFYLDFTQRTTGIYSTIPPEQRTNSKQGWQRLGKVFGLLYRVDVKPYRGLLVCNPCGWDQASWSFYRLQAGKLHKTVDFEITYSQPIRERPMEIKIKYSSETDSLTKRAN